MTKIKKQSPQQKKVGEKQLLVFGFSELKEYSYTEAKDANFFIEYFDHLKKFSQLEWNTIYTSSRHGFGSEKIPKSAMSTAAKRMMPDGMNELIVLRATGNNHVFLGYRDNNTFQVIFVEYNFGDVYSHGA